MAAIVNHLGKFTALVISGGDPAKVFKAANQTFNLVSLLVKGCIKTEVQPLILSPGNGDLNATAVQVGPHGGVAVAFVTHDAIRGDSWSSPSATSDCACF
ncbi:hypothetical protein, partial [Deinococcus arboris]|uniref:hypothetical protein n=1 Tax=Deinococcus arboris TaxID=2682977 RepID=UPI003F706A3F